MEVVCVSGRPSGRGEACRAAGVGSEGEPPSLACRPPTGARSRSRGRTGGVPTTAIRQAILSGLTPAALVERHRPAGACAGGVARRRSRTVAGTWKGRRRAPAAGVANAQAGNGRPGAGLRRAAQLYALALELRPAEGQEGGTAPRGLGCPANAGRGAEAVASTSPRPKGGVGRGSGVRRRAADQFLLHATPWGLNVLSAIAGRRLRLLGPRRALFSLLLARLRLRSAF